MKIKKLLLIFTICIFSLLNIQAHASNGDLSKGDGTKANPYLIEDIADLKAVGTSTYLTKGYYFKLINDLNLSDENWTPIGKDFENYFEGYFDGNNKIIANLNISGTDLDCQGLFGYTKESEIKNLKMTNVNIDVSGNSINIGSIIGRSEGTSIISCTSNGYISGALNVGGIVGYTGDRFDATVGKINLCSSSGIIKGNTFVGGIAGSAEKDEISYCFTNAKIVGDGAGGIISNSLASGLVIANNIVNSTIESKDYSESIHRIIGLTYYEQNSARKFENNYAVADMTLDGKTISSQDSASLEGKDLIVNTKYSIKILEHNDKLFINEPLIFSFERFSENSLVNAIIDNIKANIGNITIYRADDDTVFEVIPVTDENVSIVNFTIVVGHKPFEQGKSYYVNVDEGGFIDKLGSETKGILDKTSFAFTTESIIDTEKPTILNMKITPEYGQKSVIICADFNDNGGSEISIKKWAKGEFDVSNFPGNSNNIIGSSFEVSENGTYTLYAEDGNGNSSIKTIVINNIDTEKPTITNIKHNPNGWTNDKVIISADFEDIGNSGLDIKKYALGNKDASYFENNGELITNNNFAITENGDYTIYVKDKAGNEALQRITIDKIDKVIPSGNITYEYSNYEFKQLELTLNAKDAEGSGLKIINLENNDLIDISNDNIEVGQSVYQAIYKVIKNGTYSFEIEDVAGNKNKISLTINQIDQSIPEAESEISSSTEMYTNTDVKIKVKGKDNESGILGIKTPDGKWIHDETVEYLVSQNGIYEFVIENNARNSKTIYVEITNIDKEKPNKPSIQMTTNETGAVIVELLDNGDKVKTLANEESGIAKIEYRKNNGDWQTYVNALEITEENETLIVVRTIDKAGNISEEESKTINIDHSSPEVISISPVRNEVNILLNTVVEITFNENIVGGDNIGKVSLSGKKLIDVEWDIEGKVLKIMPQENLKYNTEYTVTIPEGAVKDTELNKMLNDYTYKFSTVKIQIDVQGKHEIIKVKDGVRKEKYTAVLHDETGNEISNERIIWSIKELSQGVNIDVNGVLTVDNTANEGYVTILAALESNNAVISEKIVQIVDEPEFIIETVFSKDDLEANALIKAITTIRSNILEDKEVIMVSALYDKNNKLVIAASSSRIVKSLDTEKLSNNILLPDNVEGYKLKVFVWEGNDIDDAKLPISNVVEINQKCGYNHE